MLAAHPVCIQARCQFLLLHTDRENKRKKMLVLQIVHQITTLRTIFTIDINRAKSDGPNCPVTCDFFLRHTSSKIDWMSSMLMSPFSVFSLVSSTTHFAPMVIVAKCSNVTLLPKGRSSQRDSNAVRQPPDVTCFFGMPGGFGNGTEKDGMGLVPRPFLKKRTPTQPLRQILELEWACWSDLCGRKPACVFCPSS